MRKCILTYNGPVIKQLLGWAGGGNDISTEILVTHPKLLNKIPRPITEY